MNKFQTNNGKVKENEKIVIRAEPATVLNYAIDETLYIGDDTNYITKKPIKDALDLIFESKKISNLFAYKKYKDAENSFMDIIKSLIFIDIDMNIIPNCNYECRDLKYYSKALTNYMVSNDYTSFMELVDFIDNDCTDETVLGRKRPTSSIHYTNDIDKVSYKLLTLDLTFYAKIF